MKGDFSRETFRPERHFLRVLAQQGRVTLDADVNEQTSILLHYLQSLAQDLIGPHGGPRDTPGQKLNFLITPDVQNNKLVNLKIGPGHYYVGGLLCENEARLDAAGNPADWLYDAQPDYAVDLEQAPLPALPFLAYLDVWERHVTAQEDALIREVALEGPDTCSRSRIVWQVKAVGLTSGTNIADIDPTWDALVEAWQPAKRGLLRAGTGKTPPDTVGDPCIVSSTAGYRGPENQLYRVEVHRGGTAATATFKWSRDNGSVVFAIESISGSQVTVADLGRDPHASLEVGGWVEVTDDRSVLQNRATPLLKVTAIDPIDRLVTLSAPPDAAVGQDPALTPLLRRWDHRERKGLVFDEGAIRITEGADDVTGWIVLEDGVQVQFAPQGAAYRTGDYWLIPARTASGDVEWPLVDGKPVARPPRGVTHRFAPLAVVVADAAQTAIANDCRRQVLPIGP